MHGADAGPAWRRTAALLTLAALCAGACATNPATGRRELSLMNEDQEIQIGQQNDALVRREMGVYDDPALQHYVEQVGMRLAKVSDRPHLPWHFTIVDVPAVNAFALPGGFIYITRGIMPYLDSEAQLAGVLGHEIGHVTARHAAQQYTRSTGAQLGLILGTIFVPQTRPFAQAAESGLGLLFLKYSREDELQADDLGAKYESRAGWDPAGVPQLLTTLGRIEAATDDRGVPNWLQTHPDPADRVENVEGTVERIEQANPGRRWTVNRPQYLQHVENLIYGDNPKEGIIRGDEFLHPALRFAVRFPEGWPIQNGQQQVVARAPGADRYVFLQRVAHPGGGDIADIAARDMRSAGFTPGSGSATTIDGLPAYVATYDGSLQNFGTVRMRAAHVRHGSDVYLLAGFTAPDAFAPVSGVFDRVIGSFRALSVAEAEAIRPNRIDLHVVQRGETWQSIAAGPGQGVVTPATLAIMNDQSVLEQPRAGREIKIVVGR
jgi:predicted Zn-dependent protease